MANKDENSRPNKPLKHGEKRIRKRNGKSLDIGKEAPHIKKHVKLTDFQRRDRNIKMCTANRRPIDQTVPKDHDGLRFIGVLLRYFSVRYDLKKEDITLCLNLYNSAHFTVEEFNRASILNSGGYTAVFRRFRELGYIVKVNHTIRSARKNTKTRVIQTDRYRLSKQIVERIKFVYKIAEQIDMLNAENFDPYLAHPGIIILVNKLNREIKDVLSGKKKPDRVIAGSKIEEED